MDSELGTYSVVSYTWLRLVIRLVTWYCTVGTCTIQGSLRILAFRPKDGHPLRGMKYGENSRCHYAGFDGLVVGFWFLVSDVWFLVILVLGSWLFAPRPSSFVVVRRGVSVWRNRTRQQR